MTNETVYETSPFSLRETINIPLLLGETMALAVTKHQPFLNVSRGNTEIYILILFLKNVFVCHGISNIMSTYSVYRLVISLLVSRLFWPLCHLDLGLIWFCWLIVLIFRLDSPTLTEGIRFAIPLTMLTALPVSSQIYAYSEFIVDFLCIANLTWFILAQLWRDVGDRIEWFVILMMDYFLFLALDATLVAKGLIFDVFVILCMSLREVCFEFRYRNPLYVFLGLIIFVYSVQEKIINHSARFQITDGEFFKHEDIITAAKDLETLALEIFRF